MVGLSRSVSVGRWALLALLAGAAACSQTPPPAAEAVAEASPVPVRADVFSVGYANISERYLEPVSIGSAALEGLKGLGAIDPAITVERDLSAVRLAASGKVLATLPVPGDDDAEGWALLTARASDMGRAASRELRVASVEKIYEAVFDGALSQLDVYSRYAGLEEGYRNRAKRQGFGGIGIRVQSQDGVLRVSEVMAATPAARGGLMTGDRITHIDGETTLGMTVLHATNKLRGAPRSTVTVTIVRDAAPEPRVLALEREHIVPETVFVTHGEGIVTLRVTAFNSGTAMSAAEKLKEARRQLGQSMRGVILDLRGNPGGLLKQSVQLSDLFLEGGDIVSTRGRHPESLQHFQAGSDDLAFGLPMVVLVDGRSASAAEIIAAALQDRGRAVVVGTTSFGKGTVQTVVRLPNDGELTLTWSRILAPSGYAFHGLGVHPTICTSGLSGAIDDIIARSLVERGKAVVTLAAWRRGPAAPDDERKQLRSSCPAERRVAAIEEEVARRLLSDPELYGRALHLMEDTAANDP